MKIPDFAFLPKEDDPESIRAWRLRNAGVACLSFFLTWFVVLPALFSFPYALPPAISPAWARDLAPIKQDQQILKESLADVQSTLLEGQMLQAQEGRCADLNRGGDGAGWQSRIDDLQKRYFKQTGRRFNDLPPCPR